MQLHVFVSELFSLNVSPIILFKPDYQLKSGKIGISMTVNILVVSFLGSFYVFYFCEETPMVGANLSYENALRNDTTLDILGDYNRETFENSCSGIGGCNCTLGL